MRSLVLLLLLGSRLLAGEEEIRAAIPAESRQLVLVTTSGWKASRGNAQRFERKEGGGAWQPAGGKVPVVTGEKGMGWGLGLHAAPATAAPAKREGDRRAPAGVFRLTFAFGLPPEGELGRLRLPYRRITPETETIDDSRSSFYNQLVERNQVTAPDWRSSEKMAEIRDYALGLAVAHNPRRVAGAGSCIFLHLLRGPRSGTAGCTVLPRPALLELIQWLDARANPVLVQVPFPGFRP
ncbi:MAG TPA: L,D-transpeptidase family protein [Chthoniobacteraceae bacterium]|jgi:D-alanyl-D-alanine dipeptidase